MPRPHSYSDEMLRFLEMGYRRLSGPELTRAFNRRFGQRRSYPAIKAVLKRHRFRSGLNGYPQDRTFTPEQERFIALAYQLHPARKVCHFLNLRFKTDYKESQVISFVHRASISCPRTGHFEKGQEPWSKGKKGLRLSPATEFKPGNKPQTWVPIGTEVTDRDGYRKVKVSDNPGVESRFNWQFVHRLEWEKHNGPVPKGHAIIFIDGDRSNCSIENLAMLTRAELVRLNQTFPDLVRDADLRRAAITASRLKQAVFDKKRKAA